jgi:hypothetical protein
MHVILLMTLCNAARGKTDKVRIKGTSHPTTCGTHRRYSHVMWDDALTVAAINCLCPIDMVIAGKGSWLAHIVQLQTISQC